MTTVRAWRWPLVVGVPVLVASGLVWRGIVRLNYDARAYLTFSGEATQMNSDLALLRPIAGRGVAYEKVPGQMQLMLRTEGSGPGEMTDRLVALGQSFIATSLAHEKADHLKSTETFGLEKAKQEARFNQLLQSRVTLLMGNKPRTPRAQLVAKVEELKARRRLLIERFPTHTDIPVLAKQIQNLVNQMGRPAAPVAKKVSDLDRRINESKLRMDYFSRRMQQAAQEAQSLKPQWKIVSPVEKPRRPNRVIGWPIMAGLFVISLLAGIGLSLWGKSSRASVSTDGLWRPEASEIPEAPVQLEVVSPEPASLVSQAPQADLPMDPLTEKASGLYAKWVEVTRALYEPAPAPPQGILDQVAPLLEESNLFLVDGHEILTKYLARGVTSGDLAAHVARTVLMTLAGAREAGVSPEHCLAMALAALFHDLAVVPRPAGLQEEVGSEVGRLSASVLPKIPGLPPALLSMVEDILIGMDEFKLDTWHNAASGNSLEPLSKVLREIDRFEKVMQKQKSRLARRVANQ